MLIENRPSYEAVEKLIDYCVSFLNMVSNGSTSEDTDKEFRALLDGMVYWANQLPEVPYEGDGDEQEYEYKITREIVEKTFPEYGFYSVCSNPLKPDCDEADVGIGDAIDDILDISHHFEEFVFLFNSGFEADAIYVLNSIQRHHWEGHLRNLQVYLSNRIYSS
jgi:hypothetical protein